MLNVISAWLPSSKKAGQLFVSFTIKPMQSHHLSKHTLQLTCTLKKLHLMQQRIQQRPTKLLKHNLHSNAEAII